MAMASCSVSALIGKQAADSLARSADGSFRPPQDLHCDSEVSGPEPG
jgi:hypothetical protein